MAATTGDDRRGKGTNCGQHGGLAIIGAGLCQGDSPTPLSLKNISPRPFGNPTGCPLLGVFLNLPLHPQPNGRATNHLSTSGGSTPLKVRKYIRPEVPTGILLQPYWHIPDSLLALHEPPSLLLHFPISGEHPKISKALGKTSCEGARRSAAPNHGRFPAACGTRRGLAADRLWLMADTATDDKTSLVDRGPVEAHWSVAAVGFVYGLSWAEEPGCTPLAPPGT